MITVNSRPRGTVGSLPLDHLLAMSDSRGIFEHAEHATPRRDHGYCLDDVSRALVVAVRLPQSPAASRLIETYLAFIEQAIQPDGRAYNRMDESGAWTDSPDVGDWWGRGILALGFAVGHAENSEVRRRARTVFDRAAQQRSPFLRAMVSAAIGAAEVLDCDPHSLGARALALDAMAAIPQPLRSDWPWPEARLSYGNAAIAEALLAVGASLGEPRLTERGIAALSFLVGVESRDGHLSVTGTEGRGPDDNGTQFDQQPIEIAAIADASARAYRLGHGERWADTVWLAWAWFLGDNDAGVVMIDQQSGAGFDGLEPSGRNDNRGAESTLAAFSTFQQLRDLSGAAR